MIWEKARLFAIYKKGIILIERIIMIIAVVAVRAQEKAILTSVEPMALHSGSSTFQLSARFRMFRSPGHEYNIIGGISYD
jgi:hypothetical protein